MAFFSLFSQFLTKFCLLSIFLISILAGCKLDQLESVSEIEISWQDTSAKNINHDKYLEILEKYTTERALPSLSLLIYTPKQGIWTGASGYAQLEDKTHLSPAHLLNASDITAMFSGVLVLRLIEEGWLNLDDPITEHLDKKYTDLIKNASKITVRNLLNHTSGIPDAVQTRNSVLDILNNYEKKNSPEDFLKYIKRKKAEFAPNEGVKYSATNTILLMLIAENVTDSDHADLLEENLFSAIGVQNSHYKNSMDYPNPEGRMNFYVDRLNDGKLENITKSLMKQNQYSAYGHDGILTSLYDLHLFTNQLFRDSLLLPETRSEMQTFTDKKDENNIRYGLGIQRLRTSKGMAWGHIGISYGSTAYVFYFPDSDATLIFQTNTSIETAEWANDAIMDFWTEIQDIALE